jgi:hypothetical protein
MARRGILAVVMGAIIGAVIGYLVGHAAAGAPLGAAIGAAIVAVGLGLIKLVPAEGWMALADLGEIASCCSSFFVLALVGTVTLSGLLFWHSLALSALAGVAVMTALLVVLSAAACSSSEAPAQQSLSIPAASGGS